MSYYFILSNFIIIDNLIKSNLMSAIHISNLSVQQKAELSCTYAAMLLSDERLDISSANIKKILTASGIKV